MKKELIDLSELASGEFGDTSSTIAGNLILSDANFRSLYKRGITLLPRPIKPLKTLVARKEIR